MTYNPATLRELGAYWTAHGGVNLGVVGDTSHALKGWSYHLGKDQLAAGASSARTARDRAGLTNAASAIDLGRLDGSFANLRLFSQRLVARARTDAPGTSDMREIIYSPDGATVMRWDRERGAATLPRREGDDSHLTHTHISWYRDAEGRDHTTAFRPYFMEDEMVDTFNVSDGLLLSVPKGAKLYDNSALTENAATVTVSPGRDMPLIGNLPGNVRIVRYVDDQGVTSRKALYLRQNPPVTKPAPAPPVPIPDCIAPVAAAVAPLNARLARIAELAKP